MLASCAPSVYQVSVILTVGTSEYRVPVYKCWLMTANYKEIGAQKPASMVIFL